MDAIHLRFPVHVGHGRAAPGLLRAACLQSVSGRRQLNAAPLRSSAGLQGCAAPD